MRCALVVLFASSMGCAAHPIQVGALSPKPHVQHFGFDCPMRVVMGAAVEDSPIIPAQYGLPVIQVTDWHATLESGFASGFRSADTETAMRVIVIEHAELSTTDANALDPLDPHTHGRVQPLGHGPLLAHGSHGHVATPRPQRWPLRVGLLYRAVLLNQAGVELYHRTRAMHVRVPSPHDRAAVAFAIRRVVEAFYEDLVTALPANACTDEGPELVRRSRGR